MSWTRGWVLCLVFLSTCGQHEPPPSQPVGRPAPFALSASWRASEARALLALEERHQDKARAATTRLGFLQTLSDARRKLRDEAAALAAAKEAHERRFPLYGVAYHFISQAFATPRRHNPVGYFRRGAQFRAGPGVRGPGCDKSWHPVAGGGFVCSGNGFLVGSDPKRFDPSPAPPALASPLPYRYAYTLADDVPEYWRLPTPEEEDVANAAIADYRAILDRRPLAPAPPDDDKAAPGSDADALRATALAEAEASSAAIDAPPPPGEQKADGEASLDGVTEEGGPFAFPDFLRMPLGKGFYVSVDGLEETEFGRPFLRTVRGAYVRAGAVVENDPPATRGTVLDADWQLPLAIVYRKGSHHYQLRGPGSRLADLGPIERHTVVPISGEQSLQGRAYLVSDGGMMVRRTVVRVLKQRGRPNGIGPTDRWIHVDLSEQTVVAYEGDRPVYGTLASTGREGFETPTGLFRIRSKHVSTTMDSLASEERYSIEDVPWTMYFDGNFAIHGAFWHYTFGRVRSHGCINLAPADALWLFDWSTPTLPPSWHGVFATRANQGTFVWIEE